MEKDLKVYILNAVEYIEELTGTSPDIILSDILGLKEYTYIELLEEYYKGITNSLIKKEEL